MRRLPGVSHAQAVRVFSKIGFRIAREGKHTVMSNGKVRLTIPRHNPIHAFTMAAAGKAWRRPLGQPCSNALVLAQGPAFLVKWDGP
jgi:predicted RNA binding protein YcfA (HicA-like mRNA interferase family)